MHAEGTSGPRLPDADVAVRSKGPATGKKPATKPTSRKTPNKRKVSNKTTKAKASGKKKPARGSSAPSSRARGSAAPIPRSLGHWQGVNRGGRPNNSADVWTAAHITEVAGWLYEYADTAKYPSIAEFCMRYGVDHQRLGEFEELIAARDYLHAVVFVQGNREAMTSTKDIGPRVVYIAKRLANVGPFSIVDKVETDNKNTNVQIYAIPENGREGKG